MNDQLNQILNDLILVKADAVLIFSSVVFLIIGLTTTSRLILKSFYVISLLVYLLLHEQADLSVIYLFSDFYKTSSIQSFFKLLFIVFSGFLVFYPSEKKQGVEFYFLMLAIIIGSIFMISANHLLLFYIAIELTSFSSYLIISLGSGKRVFEGSFKYLIFGGTSSAIMLYGISILYGYQETLLVSQFTYFGDEPFYLFGLLTAFAGLLFKVSIFPFHIWVPSTYQEGPNAAVSLVATVPKLAGFLVLIHWLDGMKFFSYDWARPLFTLLIIFTISIGVLAALRQKNVKRMVSYGAIAHSGFLMAMLILPDGFGVNSFLWYAVIYALSNLAIFMMISIFEKKSIIELEDYSGLGSKNALLGAVFTVILLALIGLPPTLGFNAKLYMFSSLLGYYQLSNDLWILTLFIVAIFSIVVSLFFYLKVPYNMFLKSSNEVSVNINLPEKLVATIFSLLLLLGFLYPELLITIIDNINLD
ncbi:MAG: NADH-quinone oxidoreductase subunit N [Cyclobacteriaceae bacterium]